MSAPVTVVQSVTNQDRLLSDLHNLTATPSDIAALIDLARTGVRPGNEDFAADKHLDEIIPKPWGYEFRAFADDYFDLWALNIDAPHATSMHVHPRKLTYLICLAAAGGPTACAQRSGSRLAASCASRQAPSIPS